MNTNEIFEILKIAEVAPTHAAVQHDLRVNLMRVRS